MNDDLIQSLWNRGKEKEPKMSTQEISNLLAKSVRTGWSRLRVNVWTFAVLLFVALVFNVLNIIGFAANPGWLAVHVGLTLITLVFLAVNLWVLRPLQDLDDPGVELTTLVKRQLHFFHTTFEWWMWVAAMTSWLLSFSASVWMENQGGHYRINQVVEFVAVSAAMVFGTYAIFRMGHYPLIQRTLAALHDLEAQVTEQTQRVQKQRKYWIVAWVLLVIALTIAVVWGIMTWLAATHQPGDRPGRPGVNTATIPNWRGKVMDITANKFERSGILSKFTAGSALDVFSPPFAPRPQPSLRAAEAAAWEAAEPALCASVHRVS